ncbi:MAG: glycosyl hydrolase 53 family protein [Muribaculaceae bacterium]|nr:glycosyl hydrolase 53 family protein [Muribaculaceae bacterium]
MISEFKNLFILVCAAVRRGAHCSAFLKAALTLLIAVMLAVPASASLRGDVNNDGHRNVSDVTALINMILGTLPKDEARADVNRDGKVNVSDVTELINLILGVIVDDDDEDLKLVGGDVSMLTKYEQKGSIYYDKNGARINDVLAYYKQQGLNAMRVRLFVNPAHASSAEVGEGVLQDLDYVKTLGKRIKDAGFKFVLDLHYSDSWADPGKQTLPADWTGLSVDQLEQKVEDYTSEVLQTLVAAGARPDYVQVGNEVTYGMLWPTGHCWPSGADYDGGTWNNFARYLNAGSRAVREVCPRAKIIIHIELSRYSNALAFFTQAQAHSVDYDIMGLSYYPSYHASTGTIFGVLTTVLTTLQGSFPDTPVMIMETAYGYAWNLPGTKYDFTSSYPYSEAGQAKFAKDLVTTLNARTNVKGLFWWWPEANEYGNSSYQVTTSWWNGSLVDNRNGRTQQAFYELLNFK